MRDLPPLLEIYMSTAEKTTADHIAQLRRDGYIDAANHMQKLYDTFIDVACANLVLQDLATKREAEKIPVSRWLN